MKAEKLLKITKTNLSGIPCLHVKPCFDVDETLTVIYYHGWESNKDNNLFLAKILAFHGYNVILPDAIYHGERGALDKYDIEELRKYFWKVIFNSVKEYEALIQEAEKKLGANRHKVAVMGNSMGGFIAGGVFAANPEIRCLIDMNGACAWEKAEKFFKEMDWEKKGMAEKEQIDEIRKYDPVANKDKIYPRSVLLLHGEADTSVPIDIQKYFYDEIEEIYKDKPERLKFVIKLKLDHYKTIGMMEETVNWLKKYLSEC